MPVRLLLALAIFLCLGGCANFKVVSEFAQQTSAMTSVVRTEFKDLDALCREQAEATIVVEGRGDDKPLTRCAAFKSAEGRLASVTIDVLDSYGNTLESLADDRNFDLSGDIDTLSGKVASLKDGSGAAFVSANEVTALSKVVQLIADVITERKREAAIKRMVGERESLATTGRILRSYFVRDPQAPPARSTPPYSNRAGLISDAFNATESMLTDEKVRRQEPIRTAELLRAGRARREALARRNSAAPGGVPAVVAAAIDAWLAALDRFTEDALKPDPKEFLDRLKELRTKLTDARNAIAAAAE